jgi:uncharacterized protein YcbK (DUF882 family)
MTSFFTSEEFACKCKNKHCEGKPPKLAMQSTLVQALNRVREEFGAPITVTSGFRCQAHNTAVGGSPKSQHMQGIAADIKPASGKKEDLERLYQLCLAEKAFSGVGDGRPKSFVHVDCRALKPGEKRKEWLY